MDKEGPSQLPGITGTRSAMVLPLLALLRQRCGGTLLQASWAQETRNLARRACLRESGCWSRPCLSHKPRVTPRPMAATTPWGRRGGGAADARGGRWQRQGTSSGRRGGGSREAALPGGQAAGTIARPWPRSCGRWHPGTHEGAEQGDRLGAPCIPAQSTLRERGGFIPCARRRGRFPCASPGGEEGWPIGSLGLRVPTELRPSTGGCE